MTEDVLIIDDEPDIRELVAGILEDEGYVTQTAAESDRALELFQLRLPSLVVLDIWLQGSRLDGLALLDHFRATAPNVPVIIISGHGTIETAVAAIKAGAYDYLEKPFEVDRLIIMAARACEASRMRREINALKIHAPGAYGLIGSSPQITQLRQCIARIGPTNSRVLIVGPCGAGKELTARMIHAHSERAQKPFVAFNGVNMPPDEVNEALFGHEQTRDRQRRIGALEQAHGGTLFLDEIGDISLETQTKILKILTEKRFVPVGGTRPVHIDVRIISSTSRDLEEALAQGTFREDLFHRLAVVVLRIPPLAERRQDIPELVERFIAHFSRKSGLPQRKMTDDALVVLKSHDWPGNVRQLHNTIERLLILTREEKIDTLTADFLPKDIVEMKPLLSLSSLKGAEGGTDAFISLPLREAREIFERAYLEAQIRRFDGNISRTAEFVGMERSALHRKLKTLCLT